MKIIDTKTGKRVGQEERDLRKKLKDEDPIKRNAEKETGVAELSPMEPPGAYEANVPEANEVQVEHPLLVQFMREHEKAKEVLERFEKAMVEYRELGFKLNDGINDSLREFFTWYEEQLFDHNQREERQLFPLLHRRLIESGEHSESKPPTTAVDMMEDDHVKFIQLSALCFNILGLAARLPDERSRALAFQVAFNNARELVELIRLHIYREDHVVFPLAQKLITTEELDAMLQN
ncbi:MAG: hemerythrin domain-containing protein [Flavobacteriales bacterium]|nr:hemerythrin domain-containing protein [Flavobacteriales bacterium]MBP9078655.1 hemerythrin domain-containing protein [Flavobacteriales bacterium]